MKARYDALAAEGGRNAVRKAIEKKQKKISQKDKRSRPDGYHRIARQASANEDSTIGSFSPGFRGKRSHIGDGGRANKKQRFD
jgi:ribosomal RNA-processing protein 36